MKPEATLQAHTEAFPLIELSGDAESVILSAYYMLMNESVLQVIVVCFDDTIVLNSAYDCMRYMKL